MDGQRNLTSEGIEKFSRALKLRKAEAAFFRNLVGLNQAKTTEEKERFAREVLRSESFRKIHPLFESQFNFYAFWYCAAIRELVGLPDFKEDPAWIARRLVPPILPREAKIALEELQKLGLIQRNASGKLVQAHSKISTQDEVSSSSVAHYHREMMRLASESINRFPRESRAIMGQTLGISRATAGRVKEAIQRFRQEIFEMVSEAEETEVIYQLNFQLFPLINPVIDPVPLAEDKS
jgi:uncharacterized protein (TIGR02147 family)